MKSFGYMSEFYPGQLKPWLQKSKYERNVMLRIIQNKVDIKQFSKYERNVMLRIIQNKVVN